jgi:glycerol uptake facilitator-like aquaporin
MFEIGTSIAIPLFVFGLNWAIRQTNGYSLSAASDFILALIAFDLAALVSKEIFEKAIRFTVFKNGYINIFVIFFCVTALLWFTIFLKIERKMLEGYSFSNKRYNKTPIGLFLCAWVLVAIILASHIFVFLYRG